MQALKRGHGNDLQLRFYVAAQSPSPAYMNMCPLYCSWALVASRSKEKGWAAQRVCACSSL